MSFVPFGLEKWQPEHEQEVAGRTGDLLEILALQKLALWEGSKKERAVGTLAGALALAEPEDYVRIFVDEGPPMAVLLSEVLEAQQKRHLALEVPAPYLRRLLAALEQDASGATLPSAGVPEPLASANSKFSSSSPPARATAGSPPSSSSAWGPSRPTSTTSTASSTRTAVRKPWRELGSLT